MPDGTVLNYNTRLIIDPNEVNVLQNRAFRFGDAIFETILIRDGQPNFLADHLERMIDGMEILGFEFDPAVWIPKITAQLNRTLAENSLHEFARVRITIFRSGTGAYLPTTDIPSFLIEATKLISDPWTLTPYRKVGIYHHIPITPSPLTRIKSANSLPYVMAARFAKQNKWDDALLRSSDGFIIEASMANLFVLHAATVFTPPVFGGCLPGIMRKQIIRVLKDNQTNIVEKHLTTLDLNAADEVFLCNSIRGIIPVRQIVDSNFKPRKDQLAPYIMGWIREYIPPTPFDPKNN